MSGHKELVERMISFHVAEVEEENSQNSEIDKRLSELHKDFTSAVKGLLRNRKEGKKLQESASRLQIIQLCKFHKVTIDSIEKLLGFSLGIEQSESK